MSADGIQFGDLEEAEPQRELRPDRNLHFAVAPYGRPNEEELPVFIDIDVMRDMETHALSDTSVELGGVMLGGQFEDEDGKPFVLISDSLRAKHYESTKGSFKFTHETWSEITRQRDEFPDDLAMVGWYHTHPDWGVFLSGMDMFICDNFFNRMLDVALVIDPVRGDRGVFQWTGDISERIRRVEGFYIVASRFREDELSWYAAQLEEDPEMARTMTGPGAAAPVIHVHDRQSPWLNVSMLGMLTIQFTLLFVLVWRMMAPPPTEGDEPKGETKTQVASARIEAQQKMLDEVLQAMHDSPAGLVQSLDQVNLKNQELQAANVGLHTQLQEMKKDSDRATRVQTLTSNRLRETEGELKKIKADYLRQEKELGAIKEQVDGKGGLGGLSAVSGLTWAIAGVVAVGLGLGGLYTGWTMRAQREELEAENEPVDEEITD